MSDNNPDIEMTGRSDHRIVEVAEVLQIDTDLIMSVAQREGEVLAFYTPNLDDGDDTVWYARLHRGDDGILTLLRQGEHTN